MLLTVAAAATAATGHCCSSCTGRTTVFLLLLLLLLLPRGYMVAGALPGRNRGLAGILLQFTYFLGSLSARGSTASIVFFT